MDIREGSSIADLIDSIGRERQKELEGAIETASRFPASVEEYMELETEERIRLAADMMSSYYPFFSFEKFDTYADHPPEKSVSTRVATDIPGIVINGSVAYDRGEYTKALNATFTDRGPAIFVWVRAEDSTDGSKSSWAQLGRINLGGELSASDEKFGKGKRNFGLDDPQSQEMIEIIDGSAAELITGVVAEQRGKAAQIGSRALRAAPQT